MGPRMTASLEVLQKHSSISPYGIKGVSPFSDDNIAMNASVFIQLGGRLHLSLSPTDKVVCTYAHDIFCLATLSLSSVL